MLRNIKVFCLISFFGLGVTVNGLSQEKLEDPEGGNGPKSVYCIKSKFKIKYDSNGPGFEVELSGGKKTVCKASFEEACTATSCA